MTAAKIRLSHLLKTNPGNLQCQANPTHMPELYHSPSQAFTKVLVSKREVGKTQKTSVS